MFVKCIKWLFRIFFAVVFFVFAMGAALGIYTLSAENAQISGGRSEMVTQALKEEVVDRLEQSPKGYALSQRIKDFVITYSPYGSDWNMNIRKIAHFSLYFVMGILFYMVFSTLKMPYGWKWLLCILICVLLAALDEWHQNSVAGRVMSLKDVMIDGAGAFCSVTLLTLSFKFLKWLGSD